MLLDPAGAVLVHLFGFLRQHGVLQVGSVETHGKPAHTSDGKYAVTVGRKQKNPESPNSNTYTCGRVILSWLRMSFCTRGVAVAVRAIIDTLGNF